MKIIIIAACLLLAGCSGKQQLWYNPGRTQLDFDRDSEECVILAGDLARQATLTGKTKDPETYTRVYYNCITGKGWSTTPPATAATAPATNAAQPSLALLNPDHTIEAFGRRLQVPGGSILVSDELRGQGDTILQNLLFRQGDLFINYTVQKSLARKFQSTDYPVAAPFFLYDQGESSGKPPLRWAVFAGNIQGSWVTGLGGFYLLNKKERIAIVITRPLPPAEGPMPAGLRLTPDQFEAVEQFRDEWLGWLRGQVKS